MQNAKRFSIDDPDRQRIFVEEPAVIFFRTFERTGGLALVGNVFTGQARTNNDIVLEERKDDKTNQPFAFRAVVFAFDADLFTGKRSLAAAKPKRSLLFGQGIEDIDSFLDVYSLAKQCLLDDRIE